jgi:hypothetical protein
MDLRLALAIAASLGIAGCRTSDHGVGAPCETAAECAGDLQCLDQTCVPRCRRGPDCGDGHACTEDGLCVRGDRQSGDTCASEVECEPGLSCVLDLDLGPDLVLDASCVPDHDGHPFGVSCEQDAECRNGTCALGRCVDLCVTDRDCASGNVCTTVPRIADAATTLGQFMGCVPSGGAIAWSIPVNGTSTEVLVPVPGNARAAVAVMSIDDQAQYVGATRVWSPGAAEPSFTLDSAFDPFDPFDPNPANLLRHTPTRQTSALMIPSRPDHPLVPGSYRVEVSSLRLITPSPDVHRLVAGSATPRVTAIVKLGDGTVLDLHFYFLDLTDHPCQTELGGALNATSAAVPDSPFQSDFLGELRLIFARAGIALGTTTFDDLPDHPDLDGLDSANLGSLLELSTHAGGVNVFVVRTITPVGLQALVGGDKNPGDPSVASPTGGVAISIDTACYRSWPKLARVTAHAIARHMGLFRNIEPPPQGGLEDPIADSPGSSDPLGAANNLMYYSEFGGTVLSDGQESILRRSAVLR